MRRTESVCCTDCDRMNVSLLDRDQTVPHHRLDERPPPITSIEGFTSVDFGSCDCLDVVWASSIGISKIQCCHEKSLNVRESLTTKR